MNVTMANWAAVTVLSCIAVQPHPQAPKSVSTHARKEGEPGMRSHVYHVIKRKVREGWQRMIIACALKQIGEPWDEAI